MSKVERNYLINISTFFGLGPIRLKLLHEYFGSFENIWKARRAELLSTGLSSKITDGFVKHRSSFDETKYRAKVLKNKVKVLTIYDSDYPDNLKGIDDPPFVIYLKGELYKNDISAVAIVGTRKMTSYGRDVCELFASSLSLSGVVIVSGLARGIDTVAHKTAIECGRTIAVIGSGIDYIYPPENKFLASSIVNKGSAIISEFPLGYPVKPYNFPIRNRLISGLSKAVLVVEGRRQSGTLLTASSAASQGREVYAVPGNILSSMSEAPLFLLQNGAKPAVSPEDIISDLGLDLKTNVSGESKPSDHEDEKKILATLKEPIHVDELSRKTLFGISEIVSLLAIMEIKGLVKNLGGGVYRRL